MSQYMFYHRRDARHSIQTVDFEKRIELVLGEIADDEIVFSNIQENIVMSRSSDTFDVLI